MNADQLWETTQDIIKQQEQDMEQDLHKVGKFIYKIFDKTSRLAKVLPDVFKITHLFNAYEYVGDSFKYIVEKNLGQSITLKYEGKHKFTYREIKLNEDSGYQICLEDLSDNIGSADIYTDVWNLLEWVEHYCHRNEEKIKMIIEQLENM